MLPIDVLDQLASSSCVVSMTAANVPGAGPIYPAITQRLATILENHARLYRTGARIVCSSDAGVGPTNSITSVIQTVLAAQLVAKGRILEDNDGLKTVK